MKLKSLSVSISVLLLCLAVSIASAQTTSTSILGTVTDASGSVVVGAKVVLRNVRTGITRTAQTTATGDYNFPLLDVGEYQITVEMPGFKT